MSANRRPLSRRTRFEVFKRDSFTCQYCGAHPPEATLHVDHIQPVVEGGGNDLDNLVTACESCNLGKGARLLSDAPATLKDRAADIAEREEQLRGYQNVLDARRRRLDEEVWRVAEALQPGCSKSGFSNADLLSIRRFVEKLGVHEVLHAAECAVARGLYPSRLFRYFCGVCWNKVRSE